MQGANIFEAVLIMRCLAREQNIQRRYLMWHIPKCFETELEALVEYVGMGQATSDKRIELMGITCIFTNCNFKLSDGKTWAIDGTDCVYNPPGWLFSIA